MKITILGCGSSVGVPLIGCDCHVCVSSSEKNKRTRSSIMVEHEGTTLVVDTSADFRAQALKNSITKLDSVLVSHCHSDHISGLSDIIAIKAKNNKINLYAYVVSMKKILGTFSYLFVPNTYAAAPFGNFGLLNPITIFPKHDYKVGNISFVPIMQNHGVTHSIGFVFNKSVAYCTDVKTFPEESFEELKNLDLLILSCAKISGTGGHASLEVCLDWISKLKPKAVVFTHMSHDFEYFAFKEQLSNMECNITPAYDGMVVDVV